ncbi:MAG: hypothetical protein HZA90_10325 [Verrucomicrobia bacterium]|nr:hypothetical protein [Verrucomicrobiota bacterium]
MTPLGHCFQEKTPPPHAAVGACLNGIGRPGPAAGVPEMVEGILAALRPVLTAAINERLRQRKVGRAGGSGSRYALRRGHRAWEVIFDWERAVVGDELGLWYVDYLLKVQPGELIHGVQLAGRALGRPVLQEGTLGRDDKGMAKLIEDQARECLAVVENPTAGESEKRAALEELERLAAARRSVKRQPDGAASKCVGAIRRAIWRLHDGLADAPQSVLRTFARHLNHHLLLPSSRYSKGRQGRCRAGVAGCFIYERPAGIFWEG